MSTTVTKVENCDHGEVEWTIKSWTSTHKIIVAAEASCYIHNLGLRFFLRPKEDIMSVGNQAFVLKSYSLWAERKNYFSNSAIKVTATVRSGDQATLLRRDGTIAFNDSKTVEVIDRFLSLESRSLGNDGILTNVRSSSFVNWPEITIKIKAELFRLN